MIKTNQPLAVPPGHDRIHPLLPHTPPWDGVQRITRNGETPEYCVGHTALINTRTVTIVCPLCTVQKPSHILKISHCRTPFLCKMITAPYPAGGGASAHFIIPFRQQSKRPFVQNIPLVQIIMYL